MTTATIWEPLAARARNWTAGWRNDEGIRVVHSFGRALVWLTVSLVAALYANSSARDGQVLAAVIAALIAMSIAVWVAVRVVPKLASGVEWRWLTSLTEYRITREGMIFMAATMIVAGAALNTSNNLLYMVLASMLAVITLSGFLSALNFRSLETQARIPDRCHAGQPFLLSIGIRNSKRVFASLSLEIGTGTESPFSFSPHYVSLIRPGSLETRTVTATLPNRGRWKVRGLTLGSRYPFGFVTKGRTFEVDAEIVAFPKLLSIDSLRLTLPDLLGTAVRFDRGGGMDLYGIREYVSTDSARHVDWKASAKTADLKTREYAAEESQRIVIEFDRYGDPGPAFERLVSEAASTAVFLVRDGTEVTLVSDEWTSPSIRSEARLEDLLVYLAEVAPSRAAARPKRGAEAVQFSLRGRNREAAGLSNAED